MGEAAKGYKVVIVMPETIVWSGRDYQAYGAELVLTPGSEGNERCYCQAQEIAAERDGFLPLQFDDQLIRNYTEKNSRTEIQLLSGKT